MTNNLIINSIGKYESVNIADLELDYFENIFVFFRNIYDNNGNIAKSFLEMIKEYHQLNGDYIYKNIIVLPEDKNNSSIFNDN
ncbi:hypothetical protein BUZ14_15450, partial [Staphylococcus gallinarum]